MDLWKVRPALFEEGAGYFFFDMRFVYSFAPFLR